MRDDLRGFFARRVAGAGDAEDLAHETFVRALVHWDDLRRPDARRSWLFSIAYNVLRDHLRARSRSAGALDGPEAGRVLAGVAPLDEEALVRGVGVRRAVRAALAALPAEQREVLLLRLAGGLGFAEIAARLGVPEGTAHTRAHYGLKRLRAALAHHLRGEGLLLDCATVRDRLLRLGFGMGREDAAEEVARHLAACPACAAEAELVRAMLEGVQAAAAAPGMVQGLDLSGPDGGGFIYALIAQVNGEARPRAEWGVNTGGEPDSHVYFDDRGRRLQELRRWPLGDGRWGLRYALRDPWPPGARLRVVSRRPARAAVNPQGAAWRLRWAERPLDRAKLSRETVYRRLLQLPPGFRAVAARPEPDHTLAEGRLLAWTAVVPAGESFETDVTFAQERDAGAAARVPSVPSSNPAGFAQPTPPAGGGSMEIAFPSLDLPAAVSDALLEASRPSGRPGSSAPRAADGQPTPAERILGLARIWSEARFGFAYWDHVPDLDWDAAFTAYAAKVWAAADEGAYWALLAEFAQLLRDGHTAVWPPERLRTATDAEPALLLEPVEGRPVVVASALEAAEAGLQPGAALTHVDGEPVAARLRSVEATVFASTEQDRAFRSVRRMLCGAPQARVRVRAEGPGGGIEAELPRRARGAYPWQRREAVSRREAAPGVALADLRTFASDDVAAAFHALFPDFGGVRALILDLRENGGGDTGVGGAVLARLLGRPAEGSAYRLRTYVPAFRAWGRPQAWIVGSHGSAQPDTARPRFDGPAAVLVGPGTCSAAEDFLVAWRSAGRGPVVGAPTCGSTGQPLTVPLPGGGGFRVCTKRDTYPDGRAFVGVGVLPDVAVPRTRAGLAAGRDEVLEAAVRAVGGNV